MRSSHILCKVHDLTSAVKRWENAGFTVQLGNAPEKAINALIWFEDGPFIELIDVKGAQPPASFRAIMKVISPNGMIRRFENWQAAPEGWCEFALETHDLDVGPDVKRLRKQGMKIFGPVKNKRTPPNTKVMITTQTAFPHETALPILMGAYHPDRRPTRTVHANGATSVSNVTVRVPPEHHDKWASLVDDGDPWLTIERGPSKIESVMLAGLKDAPAPKSINDALILSTRS